jgi:hypothetical protein
VIFTLAQGFVSPVSFDEKGDFANVRADGIRGRRVGGPECEHSEPALSQLSQQFH